MADLRVKEIRNTDLIQEADVFVPITDVEEAKRAFAFIAGLRKQALAQLGVDEDNADITSVEYSIEGAEAVVRVTQGNVD